MGKSGRTAAALEHADRAWRGHRDPGAGFPGVHRLTANPATRRAQKAQRPDLFRRSGRGEEPNPTRWRRNMVKITALGRGTFGSRARPKPIWLNAPIKRSVA